jgi:hypothetical protein
MQVIFSHCVASLGSFQNRSILEKIRWGMMPDDNKRTINEQWTNDYRRLNMRCEFNQIIDDFSIRREILNIFKISRRIWIIATVSSEGVRRHTKPKTIDNYDLLSITNENEFLKKCYSLAFARLISGNSFKCEAALSVNVKLRVKVKYFFSLSKEIWIH